MKRMVIIFMVASLFSLGCSNKKEKTKLNITSGNAMGSVLLSVSSSGVNFVDFPLRVKSVLLISEQGQSHALTTGFDANLANFTLHPQHILMDKSVPPGNYTRVMINLEFTAASKVTYFDNSITKTPVTEYMLSQTGKKLGVENKNFMINMPLMDGGLEVEGGKVAHMNIGWDLNLSTEVYSAKESVEDWIIEFKPIVKVHNVKEKTTIDVNGVFLGLKNNVISIQSIFDASPAGLFAIDARNVSNVYSGNAPSSLDNLQGIPLGSYIKLQSELKVTDGAIDIQARNVAFYDKKITTVKGMVVAIKDDTIDVLGTTISNANYLMQSNDTYRLPSSVIQNTGKLYTLFSNITINLAADEVEAMYRGGTYVHYPDMPILHGPKNTIYIEEDAEVSTNNPDDLDTFLITVNSDQALADGSKDKAQRVTVLANNSITMDEAYEVVLANGVTVKWRANGLWVGKGLIRLKNGRKILQLEEIVENKDQTYVTYQYNHKYEGDSLLKFIWDNTSEQPTITMAIPSDTKAIDFEDRATGVVPKLMLSKKIKFIDSFGEPIECSALPTGLPDIKTANVTDKIIPNVIFELIQNDDEWDGTLGDAVAETNFLSSPKVLIGGSDKDFFQGDYSETENFTSNKEINDWFKKNLDKNGKTLLVHSVTIVSDLVATDTTKNALENSGDCQFKPTYISIRWIREGTKLDAYKAAYNRKTRENIGIAAGMAVVGVALIGGVIAGIVKAVQNRRMKYNEISSVELKKQNNINKSDISAPDTESATSTVSSEGLFDISKAVDTRKVDLTKLVDIELLIDADRNSNTYKQTGNSSSIYENISSDNQRMPIGRPSKNFRR